MQADDELKVRENRLRRVAWRRRLRITKSRVRDPLAVNYGRYRVGSCLPGPGAADGGEARGFESEHGFGLTLDELEERLRQPDVKCAHCGEQARGYARDAEGRRLCHADTGPDCYRRVTVYGETVGILIGAFPVPEGVGSLPVATRRLVDATRSPKPVGGLPMTEWSPHDEDDPGDPLAWMHEFLKVHPGVSVILAGTHYIAREGGHIIAEAPTLRVMRGRLETWAAA
jgi:hypothetical protein